MSSYEQYEDQYQSPRAANGGRGDPSSGFRDEDFEGAAESQGQHDATALIRRVADIVSGAKSMPLSASVLVSKEEVLELLEESLQRLPDELRQARWLLRERDEFLARTRREAEEILEAARSRVARMVERTEIVRQAQATARRAIEEGNDEALRIRHEVEDFCDQKLAAFEIILDRTTRMVKSGREKLQVTPAPMDSGLGDPEDDFDGDPAAHPDHRGEVFFDQDNA